MNNLIIKMAKLVKPLSLNMTFAIITGYIGHIVAGGITVLGGIILYNAFMQNTAFNYTIYIVAILIFALFRAILRYAEQYTNHYIAFSLLALIRDKVFAVLRKLAPAKLESKDKGNLIALITQDIELLEVFYAHTISPIFIAILVNLSVSIFISRYNLTLGITAFILYSIIAFVYPILFSKLNGNIAKDFRNKSGEYSSFTLETLRGLDQLIQYNCEDNRSQIASTYDEQLNKAEKKQKNNLSFNTSFTNFTILAFDAIIIIFTLNLYAQNLITSQGALLSILAFLSFFGPSISVATLGSSLQNTFTSAKRIFNLLEEEPVTAEVKNGENIDFSGVNVENITFTYEKSVILKDLSLILKKGTLLGIQGKSGSGKSTLLRLLMRFWDIQKGYISISNTDIKDINTKNLRSFQSFMTQETYLFNDSVLNNIKIAKQDASLEEVINACKKASIHTFIEQLENGYDTNIAELGDNFSAGEKQRLGLARVFLHNTDFVLLDEPTSNLDSLNEAIILNALNNERENKTIILVSHRKSTLKIADEIIKMNSERVS